MITFYNVLGPDGRPLVQQRLVQPCIYLDTWAIRLFSEDDQPLGKRFRELLYEIDGTIMLSSLSFFEFTFDDDRHWRYAGAYLDGLAPRVFFSLFDPFEVMKREIQIMVGNTDQSPAGDIGLLQQYASDYSSNSRTPLLDWLQHINNNRNDIKQQRTKMAQSMLDGWSALHLRLATEPGFAKSALRDIKLSTRPRATQALIRTVFYLLRNRNTSEVTINDALDIGHSIVPASYCHYVLIDRVWSAKIIEATKFLRRYGIDTHVAQCYSVRDGGIQRMLTAIEQAKDS
jgi:hypothetical protein